MKNDKERTDVKKCLKTDSAVEVTEGRADDGKWFVKGCSAKSVACYGRGCFLVELGGDWPFED